MTSLEEKATARRDRDGLALTAGHERHLGVEVGQVDLEAVEQLARPVGHRPAPHEAQTARQPRRPGELAAGEEVGCRLQVVEEREVLVHGLDPEGTGGHGVRRRDVLAVQEDRPGVEVVHPADRLDQGRLACAVVAEQGEHLARVDVERHAVERDDRVEPLAGVPHLQDRGRRRAHDPLTA